MLCRRGAGRGFLSDSDIIEVNLNLGAVDLTHVEHATIDRNLLP